MSDRFQLFYNSNRERWKCVMLSMKVIGMIAPWQLSWMCISFITAVDDLGSRYEGPCTAAGCQLPNHWLLFFLKRDLFPFVHCFVVVVLFFLLASDQCKLPTPGRGTGPTYPWTFFNNQKVLQPIQEDFLGVL